MEQDKKHLFVIYSQDYEWLVIDGKEVASDHLIDWPKILSKLAPITISKVTKIFLKSTHPEMQEEIYMMGELTEEMIKKIIPQ